MPAPDQVNKPGYKGEQTPTSAGTSQPSTPHPTHISQVPITERKVYGATDTLGRTVALTQQQIVDLAKENTASAAIKQQAAAITAQRKAAEFKAKK